MTATTAQFTIETEVPALRFERDEQGNWGFSWDEQAWFAVVLPDGRTMLREYYSNIGTASTDDTGATSYHDATRTQDNKHLFNGEEIDELDAPEGPMWQAMCQIAGEMRAAARQAIRWAIRDDDMTGARVYSPRQFANEYNLHLGTRTEVEVALAEYPAGSDIQWLDEEWLISNLVSPSEVYGW